MNNQNMLYYSIHAEILLGLGQSSLHPVTTRNSRNLFSRFLLQISTSLAAKLIKLITFSGRKKEFDSFKEHMMR